MKKKHTSISIIVILLIIASIISVYIMGENKYRNEAQINKQITSKSNNSKTIVNNDINKPEVKEPENDQIKKEVKIREFKDGKLKYNDKSIPVLYYHSVDFEKGNNLRVPKEIFAEQMKYLKDNNYTTLTLDEFYAFLTENKPVPEKSVVITFDDGYVDNYTNAFPVLKQYGFNASIFVITKAVVDKNADKLTLEQLKEMDANGIDIESHTVDHDKLSEISYETQVKTLKESKEYIEQNLNKKVRYIVYPFGLYNENTIKAAKETGYVIGFTTKGGWSGKNDGLYTLDRVFVDGLIGMEQFKRRLANPY